MMRLSVDGHSCSQYWCMPDSRMRIGPVLAISALTYRMTGQLSASLRHKPIDRLSGPDIASIHARAAILCLHHDSLVLLYSDVPGVPLYII